MLNNTNRALVTSHYQRAEELRGQIDRMMVNDLKLTPPVDYLLTYRQGVAWLVARLDENRLMRPAAAYEQGARHLRAALGLPVAMIRMHYVVQVSGRPALPRMAPFPGLKTGVLRLGLSQRGEAQIAWRRLNSMGHVMVAGKTGAGKSTLLRSLAYQFMADGGEVRLSDLDGRTFPMLAGVASSSEQIEQMAARTLGECEHRSRIFDHVSGYPESLDEYNAAARKEGKPEMKRILLVLDEFASTMSNLGGPKASKFAALVNQLAWRGRKFGVTIVFGTQTVTKDIIGHIRDQVALTVCFAVNDSPVLAEMGVKAAANIPASRKGLAITNLFGRVQTYLVPRELLGAGGRVMTEQEERLFLAGQANGGRLTRALIQETIGVGEWAARSIQDDLVSIGWLNRTAGEDNSYCIAPKWAELVSNHQPLQPPPTDLQPSPATSNQLKASPTGLRPEEQE